MEPWKSWAAFVVLGTGAGWYYYNTQNKPKSKTGRAPSTPVEAGNKQAKKGEDGKVKSRKDGVALVREFSGSDFAEGPAALNAPALRKEKTKKGKGTKAKADTLGVRSAIKTAETTDSNSEKPKEPVSEEHEADEGIDNEEFAKMLSGLKSNKPAVKNLTKKRAREEEASANGGRTHLSVAEPVGPTPRNPSTTSSTTGADADDDLSPVASPFIEPKSVGGAYEDAGLSDMLEAPKSGPSILRLTEPTQPARTQKPKQQVFQTQETKKQRQNRKKNEARKAEREEAEEERRVLLENQRRTAREAEGRPAKNGMSFVSNPPVTSAWATPGGLVNGGSRSEAELGTGDVPYLDTFEGNQTSRTGDSSITAAAKDTFTSWERDLPSEEEQLRMISEMTDGGWNTVPSGKKGKKKGAVGSDNTGNESSGSDRQVESTKGIKPTKGPHESKPGNSDVWGFGNATPRIVVRKDGASGDDWAVDGGWEGNKQ
ncbi:MAG: hypothetical protein M1839_004383 [Geoglossum umbratile]|nr:MAG: hypothetical protein M1839_004383 [Geoglossum umbratile]